MSNDGIVMMIPQRQNEDGTIVVSTTQSKPRWQERTYSRFHHGERHDPIPCNILKEAEVNTKDSP